MLGLDFVNDDGFALVLNANGTTVRVVTNPDFKPAPFTILGRQVTDNGRMVPALERKGVRFERFGSFKQDRLGTWTASSGNRVAWFKDPDGNVLSITQRAHGVFLRGPSCPLGYWLF